MRKPLRLLLVDFKDSFTFNLFHAFESLGAEVDVIEDGTEISAQQILQYDGVILSPGPGLPEETTSMFSVISMVKGKKPLLGVCLGMQGIAQYYHLSLYNMNTVKHGVCTNVNQVKPSPLLDGLPTTFQAGLYHSWAVKTENQLEFVVTAISEDQVTMAIQKLEDKVFGVQFHPESVLTPNGIKLLENFIKICSPETF
jgi:anthranilate synthase component 2